MSIKAILTDIEGTTSSIEFVHQVLFPYAKQNLAEFVKNNATQDNVLAQINAVKQVCQQPDMTTEQVIEQLISWIEADKKEPALKSLQGLIWVKGYQNGDFTGHVYQDAYTELNNWHQQNIALYVYSSGSVKAQQLIFGYSDFGDMTPLFKGYFDTQVGHKREVNSYQTILQSLPFSASEVLFLSDIKEELDAAKQAGFNTMQLVRDNKVIVGQHPQASNFTQINLADFG
ncbi:acireductone synthase [Catenovulum sp. 2E275]|uniref:acireductone synthase n=1 Tax=Catenovulum sp. 2E275 TaxID=2980497 RepID=UPI0021D0FFAE|nr:acireductone synthase [Catenovulum sp. 2E275]MCU4676041.1 acireductone synthase [Catenovulum sp. 2E275]